MAESKYASRLRALECTPLLEDLDPGEQAYVIQQARLSGMPVPDRPLPRAERRSLIARGSIPGFFHDNEKPETRIVIADELGMCWVGPKDAAPILKKELKFSDLDERLRRRQN